jgi:hypothetical protein
MLRANSVIVSCILYFDLIFDNLTQFTQEKGNKGSKDKC